MYRGRFAPSPTGHLHLGSLLTAIASYCEAKVNNGEWIVRIEDLDPLREVQGATDKIIECLYNCGFEFETPKKQSSEDFQQRYQGALKQLLQQKDAYYCTCSRKQLAELGNQPHSCRENISPPESAYSIKFKLHSEKITVEDKIQAAQYFNLTRKDDFVLLRKEGFYAYQLAVVVDDDLQNITDVVRGIDLLDSTPFQKVLIQKLGLKPLNYAHLPILINKQGQKLSKQTFAKEVNISKPLKHLLKAYSYLGQTKFSSRPETIDEFWEHVLSNWKLENVPKVKTIQELKD